MWNPERLAVNCEGSVQNPREFRTFGKSRSVRVHDYSYSEPNVQYAITACCADRRPLFSQAPLAKVAFDTFLEVLPNKGYEVLALCVMPDHMHMVLASLDKCVALGTAIGAAKSLSCKRAGHGAIVWQAKFRDHVVRCDEDVHSQVLYAINNPVAAELAGDWQDWPWTYVYPDFQY